MVFSELADNKNIWVLVMYFPKLEFATMVFSILDPGLPFNLCDFVCIVGQVRLLAQKFKLFKKGLKSAHNWGPDLSGQPYSFVMMIFQHLKFHLQSHTKPFSPCFAGVGLKFEFAAKLFGF